MHNFIDDFQLPLDNVILDLGNIIIDIDYHATTRAFEALGVAHFDQLFTTSKQHLLFDEWETGQLTPQQFRAALRLQAPVLNTASDAAIDDAWNAMLLDLPAIRLEILKFLNVKYRLFLLSNTNELHVNQFEKEVLDLHNCKINDFFEQTYYSNQIGLRKPNVATYQWVLDQNHLDPQKTLFIDDLLPNIEGAQQAGIHCYHLNKQTTCLEQLFKMI